MFSLLIGVLFLFLTLGQCGAIDVDFGDVNVTTSLKIFSKVDETLQWATVCYHALDQISANVVCRQLGYVSAKYYIADTDELTPYVYTNIQCPTVSNYELYGKNHIMRCNLTGPFDVHTIPSCKATLVLCSTVSLLDAPYEGQVFLERKDSNSKSNGDLQVYLEGEWRKVCYNDALNDAVATSVCRQLGYTGLTNKERVYVGGRNGVEFSTYSCSQDSFACFSHCISKPYIQLALCDHVYVDCEFVSNSAKFRTSGSNATCDIQSPPHSTSNDKKCAGPGAMIAGWTFAVFFFVVISLVLSIWIGRNLCCKRRLDPEQKPLNDNANE